MADKIYLTGLAKISLPICLTWDKSIICSDLLEELLGEKRKEKKRKEKKRRTR